MRRAAALLVAVCLGACGGADEPSSSPTVRSESPPLPAASPTPTPTPPTASAPSAPSPPPDATGPEEQEGGAGDEEAARTRVGVVVDAEGITPPRTEVPAFLALRVSVRNDLPRAVTVALRGGHQGERIAARSRGSFDVPGLQPGEYPLDAGPAGRATVVAVSP
jgi:hypothetical protein